MLYSSPQRAGLHGNGRLPSPTPRPLTTDHRSNDMDLGGLADEDAAEMDRVARGALYEYAKLQEDHDA